MTTQCNLFAVAVWAVLVSSTLAADTYRLDEPATRDAVWQADVRMNVRGSLKTPVEAGKFRAMPLKVDATFRFRERRLPGAGRDAEAFRSLRQYDSAEANIEVDQDRTASKLPDPRKLIVAHGRRQGIQFYSPTAAMTTAELELLHTPGDGLAMLGLLPPREVEVGDTWTPETWVLQSLTSTDALLKGEITCRLDSVANQRAKVTFKGNVEGAVDGATTKIGLSGHYLFDLAQNYLRHVELTQTEDRTVGPVSPGMDVTASVVVDRAPAAQVGRLTARQAEAIPLDPTDEMLRLTLPLADGHRLQHGRNWKVFHQAGRVAVLRWLDKGELLAQCNVATLPSAAPGEHMPERQFEADVRKGLGEQFEKVVAADKLATNDGRFVYRVTAIGQSGQLKMTWRYYLVAAPSGQQMAFVFSFETDLKTKIADADAKLVNGLEFGRVGVTPASAP